MVITGLRNRGGLCVSVVAAALLTACGGGGGGGAAAPTPFTSYGSIVYPSTVKMSGSSQELTYTFDATGTQTYSTLTPPKASDAAFTSGASITSSWNAAGTRTSETVTSSAGTTILALSAASLDTLNQPISTTHITYGVSTYNRNYLLEGDYAAEGWNYQNFGVWLTGAGTITGNLGAASVGAETAGAAVPVLGTATFNGVSAGYYIDTAGAGHFVTSTMTAAVDFLNRSINFSTTGSAMTSDPSVAPAANNNLNLSGTLNYAVGTNQFSGSVATLGGGPSNAAMAGNASGKFYGPNAQEIGGTFTVSSGTVGSGGSAYIGGFGGKR